MALLLRKSIFLALLISLFSMNSLYAQCAGEGEGEGEGEIREFHSLDFDSDLTISLPEILRAIQFFNFGGYHCASTPGSTEDGYEAGPGANIACSPHTGDFNGNPWVIDLTELLRMVQLYNVGHYRVTPLDGTSDGFAPEKYPNVVFILMDTLRADRAFGQRNGVQIMPFLTQFAQQSANFTEAISPASWTRPSVFSMFTGLYPDPFKGFGGAPWAQWYNIAPEKLTIAEWFGSYGYDTWAVLNNGNVSETYGFTQGFDISHIVETASVPADIMNVNIMGMIDSWREPFFVYAHYIDPHIAYVPPIANRNALGTFPAITNSDAFNLGVAQQYTYNIQFDEAWLKNEACVCTPLSGNGVLAINHLYDAEANFLDSQLAIIVDEILSRYPQTILVFVSDHGEDLQNRLALGHGYSAYQEMIHVPMVIHGPGISPQTIDTPVGTSGILPTLASLLRLPRNPQWQTRDMFDTPEGTPVFSNTKNQITTFSIESTAVIVNKMTLLNNSFLGGPYLYDLGADPGELQDLSSTQPSVVTQMADYIAQHQACLGL